MHISAQQIDQIRKREQNLLGLSSSSITLACDLRILSLRGREDHEETVLFLSSRAETTDAFHEDVCCSNHIGLKEIYQQIVSK